MHLEPFQRNSNFFLINSEGGHTCLAWNAPGLQKIFEGQESWDHNFCRNPGGLEEGPLCYIDEHNVDLCQVEQLANLFLFLVCRFRVENNINHDENLDSGFNADFDRAVHWWCSSSGKELDKGQIIFAI